MRYGREYGLGNSSSRSWVWPTLCWLARCVTCARNRALPRPRDRGLGMQSGPTATPAFEPAFELSRALPSLSSSSASKFLLQRFYAPTGERLRAGSTTSSRTLTTATTTSTSSWITTPTSRRAALRAAQCIPDRRLRRASPTGSGPRSRPHAAPGDLGLRLLRPKPPPAGSRTRRRPGRRVLPVPRCAPRSRSTSRAWANLFGPDVRGLRD